MQRRTRLVPYPLCSFWTLRHFFRPESGLRKRITRVPGAPLFVLLSSLLLSCSADQCSIIANKVVKFANANCEGSSASSCWTVISFELPEQLSGQNLTAAAMPLRAWRNVSELGSHTLTVLHNGREGHPRGFDVWGEERWDGEDEPGLHFSVDTRIVELMEGPSVLQVQVLYGSSKDDMSPNTPGWMESEPKTAYAGGRHLRLEAIFCLKGGTSDVGAPASSLPMRDIDGQRPSFPSFWPRFKRSPTQSAPRLHSGANLQHPVEQGQNASTVNRGTLRGSPASDRFRPDSVSVNLGDTDSPGPGRRYVRSISVEGSEGASPVSGRLTRGGGQEMSGGCEVFTDRDEWCSTAVSRTELEALRARGAKLYCSAECASHGGLGCHVFGRNNCRVCSDDCDAFCGGVVENCACRRCSEAHRDLEAPRCSLGDDTTCYRQLSPDSSKALEEEGMGLECDPTCYYSPGEGWPTWCFAQVLGCRYCARSCVHICGEGVPECADCYECGGGGRP